MKHIHHCRFTFLANCEGVWPKKGRFIDRDTFCLRARFAAHSSKRIAECEWCFGFLSRYTCSIISYFAAASVKVWLCVIIDAVVRLCVLSTVRKEQFLLRKTGMDKIVYRYGLDLFTLFKFTRITRTPYNNIQQCNQITLQLLRCWGVFAEGRNSNTGSKLYFFRGNASACQFISDFYYSTFYGAWVPQHWILFLVSNVTIVVVQQCFTALLPLSM